MSEPLETLGGGAAGAFYHGLTPPENPLEMPEQSLKSWYGEPPKTASGPALKEHTLASRLFVFGIAAVLTVYGVWGMWKVVGQNDATGLQYMLVVLFAFSFTWIALAAANAMLGFFALIARLDWRRGIALRGKLSTRTAVLMPVYNEDTSKVFENLTEMAEELAASGKAWHFDFFVLSDTTNLAIARQEREAALRLRQTMLGRLNVYFRRRPENVGRKAGNIADFVRSWGGNYDFMLVLDADSYMTAESMIALAEAMEADSNAGLIQTVPRLVNKKTLFARMQQFATGTYGPVVSAGLAMVQGREGNYWGHNAIIRTRAFASSCGLPVLAGRKPFGGHILSHDFVEAALLRRAGWDVYMRPDIVGSYEETPPTLTDHAVRDRRWAQGNLQHSKVIGASGLHWMSRHHLLTGIMSYVASPLWLMFLVVGIALAWQASAYQPDYFPDAHALFPTWPQFDSQRAWTLLGFSAAVLLAPKVFAVLYAMTNKRMRKGAGGPLGLVFSFLLETLLSALLAPVLMLLQTGFIGQILIARDSGWNPQCRDDGTASLLATIKGYGFHSVFGLVLAGITAYISWQLFFWLLPVWLGLVLAIPLVYLSSLRAAGQGARVLRIFLIPEEREARRRLRQPVAEPVAAAS
ncbi:glucans biosynthesis glucosyltransferase MdoH [Methyloligella sp. 2.7D]|uniref:glucans biosynthesis glucosyltransferase MdoH n=1 Tax=unclassified Methyloligella TaxID=2625955 RepID=UPI00157C5378|nr:glucans biosynthesis glucosyltransferase MdoH [Methyloligella sp. GL2]QKP77141.1 glucans biosynthesis glucosyltransferase MdoH [Methyloligella sp. GL2]